MEHEVRLTLRPMDEDRYAEYLEVLIPAYAKEGARATGMEWNEAVAFAKRQIGEILPDGPRTEGQFLADLVAADGSRVGIVWYALQADHSPPRVFLYDIAIDEERRGRGLGTVAMAEVERAARAPGAGEVALHVFDHNEGAARLYERLGYRSDLEGTGGRRMVKRLDAEDAVSEV